MRKFRPQSLELVITYTSFVASIATILFVAYAIYKSDWQISYVVVSIVLSVVVLIIVLANMSLLRGYYNLHQESSKSYEELEREFQESSSVISNLKEKIKDEINTKTKIAQIVHNFSHEYRNIINGIHSDLISLDYDNFEKRKTSFRMFISYMLENIKEVFDILTYDEVSVCIKILYKKEEDFLVKTFLRDGISYRERSSTEHILLEYPCHENTAFKNITDIHCPDSYYLCNDLYKEKTYNNINRKWSEYYNACLVVPIRLIINKDLSYMLGFICVDNFKGNFDDKIAVDILASFGDNCFHLFNLFNELKSKVTLNKEGGK